MEGGWKMIRLISISLIGLVMFLQVADAEEKTIDITSCRSGTINMLTASKDLTVYGIELKGITRSNHENKFGDNFTDKCIGVIRAKPGERMGNGYCKYLDPNGGIFIVGWAGPGGKEGGTWKFLHGTGKWKGITGGGKYWQITSGKPIESGTFQYCTQITGTFDLPK